MKTLPILFIFSLLISAGSYAATETQSSDTLDQDFKRLMQWFPGLYDNAAQVASEKDNGVKHPHEAIYHIFQPVKAPAIGEETIFVKQYADGDYENVYRQRLYTFTRDDATDSVKLTIYTFLDEKKYRYTDQNPDIIADIKPGELRTTPGCEVYWSYEDGEYIGRMVEKACNFYSQRSNKRIYISDTLKLTENEIWIADRAEDEDGNYVFGNQSGIPHKNIKSKSLQ